MAGERNGFEHEFPVPDDRLWEAVAGALPRVTTQATWYESQRRVEWSTNLEAFTWGQNLAASVEPAGPSSSVLHLSGKSRYRRAIGDHHRREAVFETLVEGVGQHLSAGLGAPVRPGVPGRDEVRWWDGRQWTFDPPPMPR